MNLKNDFEDLIEDAIRGTGKELQGTVEELAAYAAERAAHLATIVGQPGFEQAVKAERDSVALRAGIATSHQAEGIDQRLTGIIQAGLLLAAKTLA